MPRRRVRPRTASLSYEMRFYSKELPHIMGVDEAGRGPWAGPVAVGVVALPLQDPILIKKELQGVRDSKRMTARQRETLVATIKELALTWGVGHATAREIDERRIVGAISLAMDRAYEQAVAKVDWRPKVILTDTGIEPKLTGVLYFGLMHGDMYSLSIAAASVLAKTWRDQHMLELHETYPVYGFASNKGYGTSAHQRALAQHGPCPEHRTYYKPVQRLLLDENA